MNIFYGTKSFLPEFQFNRRIELSETCVEVMLESVGIRKIDRVLLVGILSCVGEMSTERLAETTELGFPTVLYTELECLLGDLLHMNKNCDSKDRSQRKCTW